MQEVIFVDGGAPVSEVRALIRAIRGIYAVRVQKLVIFIRTERMHYVCVHSETGEIAQLAEIGVVCYFAF